MTLLTYALLGDSRRFMVREPLVVSTLQRRCYDTRMSTDLLMVQWFHNLSEYEVGNVIFIEVFLAFGFRDILRGVLFDITVNLP